MHTPCVCVCCACAVRVLCMCCACAVQRAPVRPHPLHLRLEDIEGHGDHRAHRAGDHAAAQRDVRWHLVRGSAAPHQPLVLSEDDEAQRLVGGRLAHGGEEAAVDARDALRLDEAVDAAQQALGRGSRSRNRVARATHHFCHHHHHQYYHHHLYYHCRRCCCCCCCYFYHYPC
eukprot:scaffold89781_cov69-Phaeocystis_antarctica.AAC.2